VLLAMALLIAACGETATTTTTAAGQTTTTATDGDTTEATETTEVSGDPILFASSLPLTGEFSIPGTKHRDGYQFCIDEINAKGGLLGRPVELLVEDNRSDSEVAVTQTERFITVEGADILLGTFSSLLTFPASAVAEQNEMVYPVPSGGALRVWERGFENLFYFQQKPAEFTGETVTNLLQYYNEQGIVSQLPSTAAVVFGDDFFAGAIANGLVGGSVQIPDTDVVVDLAPGYLADAGIEVVLEEEYPAGFTDWLTLANSIASSNAELLTITTASPDEAISLIRALQTVGYQPQVVYASQGAQTEFRDNLGGAEEGVIIHSVWHPSIEFEGVLAGETYNNADFIDGFTAAFDRAPDEDEAIPFALCQGMEQAIIGAGDTDNAAISQWLHERTADDPVRTIMGDYHWDERGLPIERDFLVNQWQDGELAFVFPVGEFPGTVDLVYPKPEW
jgi:branched-chain amino acid transport system substrate-binding protein